MATTLPLLYRNPWGRSRKPGGVEGKQNKLPPQKLEGSTCSLFQVSQSSSLKPKFKLSNKKKNQGELRIHSCGSSPRQLVAVQGGNSTNHGLAGLAVCPNQTLPGGRGLGKSSSHFTSFSPHLFSESGCLAFPSILPESQYFPRNFLSAQLNKVGFCCLYQEC